jgi:hypothetical protein
MKKLCLLILCIANFCFKAQVVFCPSGAEWRYSQKFSGPSINEPWNYKNISIKYSHDSLIDGTLVKVIRHSIFFKENSQPCYLTLLKQNGDTIFMRNAITNNAWQILYNFNAGSGQSWTNVLSGRTYTTTVLSVNSILENGNTLKELTIRQFCSTSQYSFDSKVTERFGSNEFLFYFIYRFDLGSADPMFNNMINEFLCYSDNTFGTKKFGAKDCNYIYITGLNAAIINQENIKIYPNPVSDIMYLKIDGINEKISIDLSITDLYGKELKHEVLIANYHMDVSNLPKGIYFIRLSKNQNLCYNAKFFKE